MFEQLVVSSSTRKRRRTWLCFLSTAMVWVSALSATLAVGVLAYDAHLSKPDEAALKVPVIPLALGDVRPIIDRVRPAGDQRPHGFVAIRDAGPLNQGTTQPPVLMQLVAAGPAGNGGGTGDAGPAGPGVPFGVPGGEIPDAPRPVDHVSERRTEVRTDEAPRRPQVIRSVIIQGNAIRKVEPQYPAIARQLHISGSVVVEVVIGEQGEVVSARALSGHP
ncbi:MAG TPA: energy transducer TonB, partial [Blastocatellia bacterium]|nr:energy transducer TonB [Blastocatellia bacterium]